MLFFSATYLLNDLDQVSSPSYVLGEKSFDSYGEILTYNLTVKPQVLITHMQQPSRAHVPHSDPLATSSLLSQQYQPSNPAGLAPKPLAILVPAFLQALGTMTAPPKAHFK